MNPTVLRKGSFRFFFFSREEERQHVHINSPKGEAKFWLEPTIALHSYTGFSNKELRKLHNYIEENYEEIIQAWKEHFKV